jgi:hypothetical protein
MGTEDEGTRGGEEESRVPVATGQTRDCNNHAASARAVVERDAPAQERVAAPSAPLRDNIHTTYDMLSDARTQDYTFIAFYVARTK